MINKKLITYATRAKFDTDLAGSLLSATSIVFIQDTGELWTHGKFFGGNFSSVNSNYGTLTLHGSSNSLSLYGHKHPYTDLTGSTTTANQAIVSNGTANGWTLATLGSNAFNSTAYLPLSGGTLTNSVFLPLNIPAIRFGNGRTWDSAIGHDTSGYEVEAFMTKSASTKYRFKVGFDPTTFAAGTFTNMTNADLEIGSGYGKIAGNIIWHAGNDGSGSGLDADLLDGYHAGFSNDKILKLINFPAYTYFGSSSDNNDYYQNIIKWVYNNANDGTTTLAIGVGHPNSLGNLQIQLYGTSGYDSTTNFPRYSSAIYYPLGNNPPVMFGTVDYTYYQYTIARTTDNVASATKLQTTRTIWGQSFDGTANVSGALTGVSTISMSGQLTSTLASGTAPFSITSTTLNSNLNADLLDGQHGSYYTSYADNNFVKLSGGTMTGALNFKNSTWNNVGDDVAIGDMNSPGRLCIKALSATNPGIAFYNSSSSGLGQLDAVGSNLQWSGYTILNSSNFNSFLYPQTYTLGISGTDSWVHLLSFSCTAAYNGSTMVVSIANRFKTEYTIYMHIEAGTPAYGTSSIEALLVSPNGDTTSLQVGYVKTPGDGTATLYDIYDIYLYSTAWDYFFWKINSIYNNSSSAYTIYNVSLATTTTPTGLVTFPIKSYLYSDANSVSTTKLLNARTINGTSFDGTGNITTSLWGTARNISIGGTSKSVNGSADITWAQSEISANYATSAGNATTAGGFAINSSANPFGKIPTVGTDGVMELGKILDFHYDNTTGSNYSTRLNCTGNNSNNVNLPSTAGTLALLTDNVASATRSPLLANLFSSRPTDANITVTGSGGMSTFKATYLMTSNKPACDGHIIHMYWDTAAGYDSQLFVGNGNNNYVQYRNSSNGTWNSWISILDSNNYTNYNPLINGSHATSVTSIYAPTSQLSVQSAANSYLIGSTSTTSLNTVYSNSSVYMNGSTLYASNFVGNITGNLTGTASNSSALGGKSLQNILECEYSGRSDSGTSTGWFRIGELLGYSSRGQNCIIEIHRAYYYTNTEAYIFSVSVGYNGNISITQLSGVAGVRLITKIRADWSNSGKTYIDLYIATSATTNSYYWTFLGNGTAYTTWTPNPTLAGTAYEFFTTNGLSSDKGITGSLTGTASLASTISANSSTTTQAYLLGATASGTTPIYDPGIYITSTSGTLHATYMTATTFTGNLTGTASNATLASTISSNLNTNTKGYLLAQTASGTTPFYDSGIYIGTTSGNLIASTFTGNLVGTATNSNTLGTYGEASFIRYRGEITGPTHQALGIYGWSDASYASNNLPSQFGDALELVGYTTWYHRLCFSTNGTLSFYQGINTTTMTFKGTLAFAENVPTKTGSGASGTWGISISGNAVTATSANSATLANTITSNLSNTTQGCLLAQTSSGTTPFYDSGIYIGAAPGNLIATTFTGNLVGNASTSNAANGLANTSQLWGQGFDGTGDVSGNISNTGNILPSASNTYTIGVGANYYSAVYASNFYGNLNGNANSATNIYVNYHSGNNVNYPIVWTNQVNTSNIQNNQLYKTTNNLYFNPSTMKLTSTGGFVGNLSGTSDYATYSTHLYTDGSTAGTSMTFHWSGQSGQPTWLWGGSSASDMYVYNPSNFSVNYATSSNTTNILAYMGLQTIDTSGTLTGGVQCYGVYGNGYPADYGNVINIAGQGYGQLLIGWSGTTGAHADNYIRSLRDSAKGTNGWSAWAKIITSVNYNTYALPLSGGTLTGLLTANAGIASTTGTFSSTLGVTGATTLSSTLGVSGATTISSTLGVSGLGTFSNGIYVTSGGININNSGVWFKSSDGSTVYSNITSNGTSEASWQVIDANGTEIWFGKRGGKRILSMVTQYDTAHNISTASYTTIGFGTSIAQRNYTLQVNGTLNIQDSIYSTGALSVVGGITSSSGNVSANEGHFAGMVEAGGKVKAYGGNRGNILTLLFDGYFGYDTSLSNMVYNVYVNRTGSSNISLARTGAGLYTLRFPSPTYISTILLCIVKDATNSFYVSSNVSTSGGDYAFTFRTANGNSLADAVFRVSMLYELA